jgi:N-acetylneuraminate synthase/sialic acid synthase
MRELSIDGKRIRDDGDCWMIAEIGHNHQGKLETAKEMFRVAKECGADAVKLQKRDNRQLYTKAGYEKPYENINSYGATYGEHREALEFGWHEYSELKDYAKEIGITFFSTAFDFSSADFIAKLDLPAFKIASGDLKNIPLLTHIAKFQKPMIVSTGGGTMEDVNRAYDAIMPINQQLALLQCTAGYPAEFEELNLRVITSFRERFPDSVVGLSSHDNGIAMAVAAYMLGARIVEKHFTLNHTWKGLPICWAPVLSKNTLPSTTPGKARITPFLWSPSVSRRWYVTSSAQRWLLEMVSNGHMTAKLTPSLRWAKKLLPRAICRKVTPFGAKTSL